MDNLCHTLCGMALTRVPGLCRSRWSAPALVVAANLPDTDAIVRWTGGTAAYLEHHRGITHALAGIAVQIVVLTAIVAWLERRFAPRPPDRTGFGRDGPFLAIAAGLISHFLLDLLNVYGVRPWLPFDGRWIHGDLAFIVDPWMWLVFGGTAALAGRSRAGRFAFALLLAAPPIALYGLHRERAPEFLLWAWPAAAAAVAIAYAAGFGRRGRGRVVAVGAALLAAYLGVLAFAARDAVRQARAAVTAAGEGTPAGAAPRLAFTPLPAPARPFAWTVLADAGDELWFVTVATFGDAAGGGAVERIATLRDDPAVRRVAATPAGRAWLGFARHPVARIHASGAVDLTDGRYLFTDFCTIRVPP